jgi:hypothetical protein
MNYKGFGRKRSWSDQGTISAFVWSSGSQFMGRGEHSDGSRIYYQNHLTFPFNESDKRDGVWKRNEYSDFTAYEVSVVQLLFVV